MQLGISSYTFTWAIGVPGSQPDRPMTALILLERAAELGVRRVQVADNLPLDRLTETELDELADCAKNLRVSIEVGTRGIVPEHLGRYLALAQRFGSPILRVVMDGADHHPSPSEVVDLLLPWRVAFEKAGIVLAIENHDRFSSKTLVGLIEQLGRGWVGVCLDTVNSFGALEGPALVLETLGPLVVNLHVKDFTIFRASHMMGFNVEGRPAGQGKLDIPWVLSELKRYGRDPNAILELWTPPASALAATIAKEASWAEESVIYLKGLGLR